MQSDGLLMQGTLSHGHVLQLHVDVPHSVAESHVQLGPQVDVPFMILSISSSLKPAGTTVPLGPNRAITSRFNVSLFLGGDLTVIISSLLLHVLIKSRQELACTPALPRQARGRLENVFLKCRNAQRISGCAHHVPIKYRFRPKPLWEDDSSQVLSRSGY